MASEDDSFTLTGRFSGVEAVEKAVTFLEDYDGSSAAIEVSITTTEKPAATPQSESNTTSKGSSVREGSLAFQALEYLASSDGWELTTEIIDAIDDDSDQVRTALYSLGDRGLVEKRRYEDDGRQREYRLTDEGKDALSRAQES